MSDELKNPPAGPPPEPPSDEVAVRREEHRRRRAEVVDVLAETLVEMLLKARRQPLVGEPR
jgi:hypothetical protein